MNNIAPSLQPSSNTVLRGSRLILARLSWFVLVLLVTTLFVVGIPLRYRELTTPLVETATVLQYPARAGWTFDRYLRLLFLLELIVVVLYAVNALLLVWPKANNWVALYVSATGLLYLTYAAPTLAALVKAEPTWLLPVTAAQALGAGMAGLMLFFFPDGRFVPRWTTGLAIVLGISWLGLMLLYRREAERGASLFDLDLGRFLFLNAWYTIGLSAQIYRYRRWANALQRQQTKWAIAGIVLAYLGLATILLVRYGLLATAPRMGRVGSPVRRSRSTSYR